MLSLARHKKTFLPLTAAGFSSKRLRPTRGKSQFDEQDLPQFQDLLRSLYKKAHPDLLRSSNPEMADTNDKSFQVLNGVISTIKTYNEYPPQMIRSIPFHLKRTDGSYTKVELSIRTAGGDCRKSLANSFELFFRDAGICNSRFAWGKDFFPLNPTE